MTRLPSLRFPFSGILALFVFVVACGGSSASSSGSGQYDSLFQVPPGTATADKIDGLWGGSVISGNINFDFRAKVEDTRVTFAGHCKWTDGTMLSIGASASARVTQKPSGDATCFPITPGTPAECGDVEFLESQSDRATAGSDWCSIDIEPQFYDWTMSGLRLRITIQGLQLDLVKITD